MTKQSKQSKEKLNRKLLERIIEELKELSCERDQYIRARTRTTNQMKSIVRRVERVPFGKPVTDELLNKFMEVHTLAESSGAGVIPLDNSRADLTTQIKQIEKEIKERVRKLPIWYKWAENISGVGEISIGMLVGKSLCTSMEDALTGKKYKKQYITIGDYANPAKLWKRWGVGMVAGERQRKVASTIEERRHYEKTGKMAGKLALAIKHGYSPDRRATLWNLGDCFVKQGKYYRKRYDQEKARQLELHPEVYAKKIKTGKKGKNSASARAHNRAMRYSTKLFLRDMWNKWREFHGEGEYHKLSGVRD